MKASFKFFRHKDGLSAYAEIGLESSPSPDFAVTWSKDVSMHEENWGNAVREGVMQALHWHRELGGDPARFTISAFGELLVDTREDAVRCASTAAAWIALGHLETELVVDFDGTWTVSR